MGSIAMTITGYRRLTIVLGVLCAALLVAAACLAWSFGWLTVRVAFASEQTEVFEDLRERAIQSDVARAASYLEYVVRYYPSGTKQVTDSHLDRIVERQRAAAVRDMLAHLRAKSGEDLGASPEAWIQKYGKR
jgi:hypothetical protein